MRLCCYSSYIVPFTQKSESRKIATSYKTPAFLLLELVQALPCSWGIQLQVQRPGASYLAETTWSQLACSGRGISSPLQSATVSAGSISARISIRKIAIDLVFKICWNAMPKPYLPACSCKCHSPGGSRKYADSLCIQCTRANSTKLFSGMFCCYLPLHSPLII